MFPSIRMSASVSCVRTSSLFETFTVLDTVIMGHGELWEVKQERDRIYALPEMSEEDGL
ncbi:heme ABC transporter ATP-binding protein [Salmonella enterica subsp. enterica]|uniref:Heme ABC transporter ATP-binding protein n=1 Tax=Salmonella enterica I TaxID=59201 RepID=A0A447MVE1_SALET|nr:heme ABC transporter ATP-binding protein [Salmonella enterica subsp. enterica]